jgi:hypothetical protein
VVQRLPEYVNPADEAGKVMRGEDGLPQLDSDLDPINEAFGRKFQLVSFRWLNKDEI